MLIEENITPNSQDSWEQGNPMPAFKQRVKMATV